jgi:diguanylate cyclase (GGDEF)-like protein
LSQICYNLTTHWGYLKQYLEKYTNYIYKMCQHTEMGQKVMTGDLVCVFSVLLYGTMDPETMGMLGVLLVCAAAFGGAGLWAFWSLHEVAAEKERYDLISEQRETLWLDYTFSPAHLRVYGDISRLTGFESLDMMGMEVYEIYDWVNEETTPIRANIRNFFDSGERYYNTELQLKLLDGSFAWYSMTGTLQKNKNTGKNQRFVVALNNVDSKRTQEKELTEKAENDLLTGVLNKKTMESKVSEALSRRCSNQHYIFFMIDLDNFKSVNDTLGHIYGDKVLTDTASKLKELFPNRSLIGRLGGDEFAVCAYFEAFDSDNLLEYMRQKGETLCDALCARYDCDGRGVNVSVSVGIAAAPVDGDDFERIYQKADKALYLSKRSGKNCYNIFQRSDGEELHTA